MRNTSLLKFEFKKLLGHRYLILFIVGCLIINGVICYLNADRTPETTYVQQMLSEYEEDAEPFLEAWREIKQIESDYDKLYVAYIKGQIPEEPQLIYPCNYSGKEDLNDDVLLRRLFDCVAREDEYRSEVEQYVNQAKINKDELLSSYGGLDKSSFAYQKQVLIEHGYTQVLEQTQLFPEAGNGWNQLFAYDAVNIWMLLAVIAGTITLVFSEQGNASMILRCSKKGRFHTAFAKSMALFGWVFIVLFVFTATTMLAILFKSGGYSSLTNSIAIFEEYTAIPIALTVGEFLGLTLVVRFVSLCVIGFVCACVCLLLRSISLSFATTITAVGIQYVMFLFGQTDGFKYLNIVGTMSLSSTLSTFRCASILGYAVEFLPLTLTCGLAFAVIGAITFQYLFCITRLGMSRGGLLTRVKCALIAQKKLFRSKIPSHRISQKRRIFSTSLFAYEWRKTFTSRGVILLLILTVILKLSVIYVQYDSQNTYSLTLYSQYIEEVQGDQNDEKRQYIETETKRIKTVIEEFQQKKQEFYSGNISYDEYREILEEYNIAVSSEEVAERVMFHSEYLDWLANHRNVNAHYLYDIDWLRLFETGSDIILIALLAYLSAGVFSDEHTKMSGEGNRMLMISATKKGRTDLYHQKLSFSLLISLIITLLFNAIDGWWIVQNFKLPNGESPLLSLERFGGIEYSGSIHQFIATTWIIQLFVALVVAGIVTMLGALIKNKLYALLSSFSLLFIPYLFKKIGLSQFAYFDISNGFDAEQLWLLASKQDVLKDYTYILLYFIVLLSIFAALLLITYRRAHKNKS